MAAKRNLNMDLVRCVAVFSVVAVHFFKNSGYYSTPLIGEKMLVATIARTLFMVCVPLFMLITGYFMCEKQIELSGKNLKSFYGKLSSVLIPYTVITVLIIVWRIIYKEETLDFKNCLLILTDFTHYSWYVEMYIGLYLLIPFINLIWKNIGSKKSEFILIIILLCLTTLPTVTNIWNFTVDGWFSAPKSSSTYNDITPEWWTGIYPVTYYFIGAYIRKNVDFSKIRTGRLLILFVFCVVVFGLFNFWRGNSGKFISGIWCAWNGFQNLTTSVLLFLIINSFNLEKIPSIISKTILWISKLSFGTYLASYITDITFYPILCEKISAFRDRLLWAPVLVLASFAVANIISLTVYLLESIIRSSIKSVSQKKKQFN